MTNKTRIAAAAAAITAGILAGCATPNATGAPADDFGAQATYDLVIHQVYGSAEHRAEAAERAWLLAQTAIATCARDKGVVYAVTPYQPMENPGLIPAPGDLLGFAPHRTDFGVGARIAMLAKRGEPTNPGLAKLDSEQDRDKWFQAVTACQNAPNETDLLIAPKGQQELENNLISTLSALQKDSAPDLDEQYAACMKAAGIAATDLSEAYQIVEAAYPPVSYEKPSDPTRLPEWVTAIAFERKVAAADWACRGTQAETLLRESRDTLSEFATAHAGPLAAVSEGWAKSGVNLPDLRAKAERFRS
jgi:hypothetical protein